MELKTFETHTFAVIKDIEAIELSFNVWASKNKNVEIIRTDYFVNQRINKNNQKYEKLTLLVFYKNL